MSLGDCPGAFVARDQQLTAATRALDTNVPPPPEGFPRDLGLPRANRCFGRVTYQAWTFVGTEWQPGILIADFALVENGEQILGVGVLPPEIVAQGVPVPRITCRLVRTAPSRR